MTSYKFEFNEYAWDLLYFLIMKRFSFDMEFIRLKRHLYEKPIVSNLEHENQLRMSNRNKNKQVFKFIVSEDKNKKKICNKNFPVCLFLNKDLNCKNLLINCWIITKNNGVYFEKNPISDNYFFDRIFKNKRKDSIIKKSNFECFKTAKNFLEKMNNNNDEYEKSELKFKSLQEFHHHYPKQDKRDKKKHNSFSKSTIYKSNNSSDNYLKSIPDQNKNDLFEKIDSILINKNNKKMYSEENEKKNEVHIYTEKNENNWMVDNSKSISEDLIGSDSLEESELEDLKKIKKIKEEFSKSLDKINLNNLQIVNFNLKGLDNSEEKFDENHNNFDYLKKSVNNSSVNVITNFDKLENLENEMDILDDLMIERNIHVCQDSDCISTKKDENNFLIDDSLNNELGIETNFISEDKINNLENKNSIDEFIYENDDEFTLQNNQKSLQKIELNSEIKNDYIDKV